MAEGQRPAALVTGGSRGIGAATAEALARGGCDVAIVYRNKATRAEAVVRQLRALGVSAAAFGCDITVAADRERLFAALDGWRPRLDALILNASGGLERDLVAADPAYPMRINRDAQLALVDLALPRLPAGGVIVLVTSHWAHRYGEVRQFAGYEPVARSKHAGEVALLARQAELAAHGVRLVVVTGDVIEGTIVPRLLERDNHGFVAQRRAEVGRLPTAEEMGEAVAAAAMDPGLPSGHVVVVGGDLASLR